MDTDIKSLMNEVERAEREDARRTRSEDDGTVLVSPEEAEAMEGEDEDKGDTAPVGVRPSV